MTVQQKQNEADVNELGPVDWIVVEFAAANSTVRSPRPSGTTWTANSSGSWICSFSRRTRTARSRRSRADLEDSEIGELRSLRERSWRCCSARRTGRPRRDDRARQLGRRLVWENKWAAPFGAAVRQPGAARRQRAIPIQAHHRRHGGRRRTEGESRCLLPGTTTHAPRGGDWACARRSHRDHRRHGRCRGSRRQPTDGPARRSQRSPPLSGGHPRRRY